MRNGHIVVMYLGSILSEVYRASIWQWRTKSEFGSITVLNTIMLHISHDDDFRIVHPAQTSVDICQLPTTP